MMTGILLYLKLDQKEIMNGLKPLAGIVIVRVHTLHGKQEMVDIFLEDMLMIMKK